MGEREIKALREGKGVGLLRGFKEFRGERKGNFVIVLGGFRGERSEGEREEKRKMVVVVVG